MSFEKKIERLEQIVQEMEKGELNIEQSLKFYEEGIGLSKECHKILTETEQKITILQNNKEEVAIDSHLEITNGTNEAKETHYKENKANSTATEESSQGRLKL